MRDTIEWRSRWRAIGPCMAGVLLAGLACATTPPAAGPSLLSGASASTNGPSESAPPSLPAPASQPSAPAEVDGGAAPSGVPGGDAMTGTVLDRFTCPVCPPNRMCKPCVGNHIRITPDIADSVAPRLFTETPERYEVGKRYRFTVEKVRFGYRLIDATPL